MKIKVHSSDEDTDFFDIFAGVLQGDTLALYWFIICQDNIFQTLIDLIKEYGYSLKIQEANNTTQKLLQTQTTQMT